VEPNTVDKAMTGEWASFFLIEKPSKPTNIHLFFELGAKRSFANVYRGRSVVLVR
jgi:hypothetical protein